MKQSPKAIVICLLILMGCAPNQAQNQIEIIDKATFIQLIDDQESLTIIDVRTTDEVAQGSVAGSVNIDWFDQENFKESIEQLDKSTPVVVYCMSGKRSAQAAAHLADAGFLKVYDYSEGYIGWSNNE